MSAPDIAWQRCLKKTGVKLEFLTDVDMLFVVEWEIRGAVSHAIPRYAKAYNKDMKNYNKIKELFFIQQLVGRNLYEWAMSQKLPVVGFKWKKKTFEFNEYFIKDYDEDSEKGCILEEEIDYPKDLHDLYGDLPFLQERMKINKCNKLVCIVYNKRLR